MLVYTPLVAGKKGEPTDLCSRLLEDRIIMLNGDIEEDMAQSIVTQLLYLESVNPKEDITLYINSGGGVCTDGFAIIDCMNLISCDVKTVVIGQACSMGAMILSCGTKGKRYALPNSEIMIHQPLGGAYGQATDIKIQNDLMQKTKQKLTQMLADNCGQEFELMHVLMERDYFMNAKEGVELGIVDKILEGRKPC